MTQDLALALAQALLDLDERICAVEPTDVDFFQGLVQQRAAFIRKLVEHPRNIDEKMRQALQESQARTESYLQHRLGLLGAELRDLYRHRRARQRYAQAGREDLRYE